MPDQIIGGQHFKDLGTTGADLAEEVFVAGGGTGGSILVADQEGPLVTTTITAVSPAAPAASVAGGTLTIPSANMDGVAITADLTGYTGNSLTLAFYWSPDGVNYFPTFGQRQDGTRSSWLIDAPGAVSVQARATVFVAGGTPPTITGMPSSAPMAPQTVGALLVGTTGIAVATATDSADAVGAVAGLFVLSAPYGFTSATTKDRLRTPFIFKTATVTAAGNTAGWTPAAGKKVRAQRLRFLITGDASLAAASVLNVTFQDAAVATAIPGTSIYLPIAQPASPLPTAYDSGWMDLGNGILSATINNILNVNLSAALTTGKLVLWVCGTEE
jgi:hypothetical protein